MVPRIRLGVVVTVAMVLLMLGVVLIVGRHGHQHPSRVAAPVHRMTTSDSKPTADPTPTARSASSPARTTSGQTTRPAAPSPGIPPCSMTAPASSGNTAIPPGMQTVRTADTRQLVQHVTTFLQTIYQENWNDTHACRVSRTQSTHLVAGNWVYRNIDLSVSRSTVDDIYRFENRIDITPTVLVSQMSDRAVTPTDIYVFTPVLVTAPGRPGSVFKTGSTWLYRNGSWVVNDFGAGGDS